MSLVANDHVRPWVQQVPHQHRVSRAAAAAAAAVQSAHAELLKADDRHAAAFEPHLQAGDPAATASATAFLYYASYLID